MHLRDECRPSDFLRKYDMFDTSEILRRLHGLVRLLTVLYECLISICKNKQIHKPNKFIHKPNKVIIRFGTKNKKMVYYITSQQKLLELRWFSSKLLIASGYLTPFQVLFGVCNWLLTILQTCHFPSIDWTRLIESEMVCHCMMNKLIIWHIPDIIFSMEGTPSPIIYQTLTYQMISVLIIKFGFSYICFIFLLFWSYKYVVDREHWNNCKYFIWATNGRSSEKYFAQVWY